jgi:flagellar basal-body rod modification protein FlgD
MSVSSIGSLPAAARAAAAPTQAQAQASQLPQQTLNQNDFLQLLVAQLSQQDPMNPVSDTDFAAQMAQFSALQESQTMQGNMAGIQANALLGQTVILQPSQGSPVSGIVSSVQYNSGTPSLIVNGQSYTMSQVLAVAPTSAGTAAATQTPSAAKPQS